MYVYVCVCDTKIIWMAHWVISGYDTCVRCVLLASPHFCLTIYLYLIQACLEFLFIMFAPSRKRFVFI